VSRTSSIRKDIRGADGRPRFRIVMAKLSVHGEPVADYVRRSTNLGDCEVTCRLMSDGVFLKQTVWSKLGPNRRPYDLPPDK
jgi:hypothetical protein